MASLNFDGCNTLYATHQLHPYAAKCPPQLVRYGLRYYSKPGETVLDPMAGSGTVLVEARLMDRGGVGFEIDPLALLIARAKCRPLHEQRIDTVYQMLAQHARCDLDQLASTKAESELRKRAVPPDFANRDYWFEPPVSQALAVLLWHIEATPMPREYRDFFRVAFSSLILSKNSVANARDVIHSRHHHIVHAQPPDVMKRFEARVRAMRRQMEDFRQRCHDSPTLMVDARLGDARQLPLDEESIDLIFTSPPYATALDYPRAHFLAIAWLQQALGVDLDQYMTKASTYIGAERGRFGKGFRLDGRIEPFNLARSVVQSLAEHSTRQANLTQRYFADMSQVLSETARVLKPGRHAIIVVCPSHIRKVQVPTHEVLVEMGQANALHFKQRHTRTIDERRRLLPYMQEAFGQRMSTEYVLIFQKK